MILVRVSTLDPRNPDEVLGSRYIVTSSIGTALNFKAPSPAEGAMFKVEVIAYDVIIAD